MHSSFRLYKNDEQALYVQAANGLRQQILGGEYRPGDKLPSVRRLSDELGVNPATIVSAYRILSTEGLIESRAGSGVFVSKHENIENSCRKNFAVSELEVLANKHTQLLDLSTNSPARSLYPLEDMKRFLVDAVDKDGGKVFDYQDSPGYQALKNTLAERLSKSNAAVVDPLDVHIVSGAQQGLDLAARLLLRRGDIAVIESPGYSGVRSAFLAAGAKLAPVELDKNGIDLDALEKLATQRTIRLVYVNPAYQNPVTLLYSNKSKERLALMAARFGFYILEDDQVSELGYEESQEKPLSVRAFDKMHRVFFVKSFSKTLMPGLRIACLEAPKVFRESLENRKISLDLSSNSLMQRVLESFLSSGRYDERLNALRSYYKNAARIFAAGLKPYKHTGFDWNEPKGGLNLWLTLPAGLKATTVSIALAAAGCSVVPEAFSGQKKAKQKIGIYE